MCYSQGSVLREWLRSLYQTYGRGQRKLDEKTLPFSLPGSEGRRLPLDDKLNWYSPQPRVLAPGLKPADANKTNEQTNKTNKQTKRQKQRINSHYGIVLITIAFRLSKNKDLVLDR